jgi:hypothetical protein
MMLVSFLDPDLVLDGYGQGVARRQPRWGGSERIRLDAHPIVNRRGGYAQSSSSPRHSQVLTFTKSTVAESASG